MRLSTRSRFIVVDHLDNLKLSRITDKKANSIQEAWAITFDKWRTLKALQESGKIVDDGGWQTCGLCDLFFPECYQTHIGCPVELYGYAACIDTPYETYHEWTSRDYDKASDSAEEELQFLTEVYRWYVEYKRECKENHN